MGDYFLQAELRDPTVAELHNGPTRDTLPAEVQEMSEEQTACTYCGVSYLVFSEVQSLRRKLERHQGMFAVRS